MTARREPEPPPERVAWSPLVVDREAVWTSEDGRWVLLTRAQLDALRERVPTEEVRLDSGDGPDLGLPSRPRRFSEDSLPTVLAVRPAATTPVQVDPPVVLAAQAAPVMADTSLWHVQTSRRFLALSAMVLAIVAGVWLGVLLERVRTPPGTHALVETSALVPPPGQETPGGNPPAGAPATPTSSTLPNAAAPPPAARLPAATPPRPAPAAPPAKTAPTKSATQAPSARTLTAEGWSLVESAPGVAVQRFEEAMRLGGGTDTAHGYGYALLKLGRAAQAQPYLCRARRQGGDVAREIDVLLARHGLACSAE